MTIPLFIVLAVIGFLTVAGWVRMRKRNPQSQTPYLDALHLLLEGKNDDAMEELKRTVQEDSDNIMAYITLGDILRDRGFAVRAAKIHRNLLLRNTLTEHQTDTVFRHLVLDYKASGLIDRAVETAERLVQHNKKDMNTKRLLLGLYEDKGDWDKAYFLRQSLNRWLKRKDHYILALYRVQSGIELVQRGAEREARIRFREAIKLDKSCAPAYLYWGDSYRRENRNADAVQVWLDFTETNPESAYLAFERLNGVLYDLGRYNEMEAIYKNVISRKPKNPTAYLNLIDIYKKQGKLDEALDLCESIFENHPDSPQCRLMRVQLLQMKGLGHKALEEVTDHLGRETEKSSVFRCKTCGNESQTPLWHCPQCKQWNTYIH